MVEWACPRSVVDVYVVCRIVALYHRAQRRLKWSLLTCVSLYNLILPYLSRLADEGNARQKLSIEKQQLENKLKQLEETVANKDDSIGKVGAVCQYFLLHLNWNSPVFPKNNVCFRNRPVLYSSHPSPPLFKTPFPNTPPYTTSCLDRQGQGSPGDPTEGHPICTGRGGRQGKGPR